MATPARLACAFLSAGLGTTLLAQQAAGTVRGFTDEPAERATVRALDDKRVVLAEVLTDERGAFVLQANAKVAHLLVQIEGVVVELPVADGGVADAAVTFAAERHATIRGNVVDPGGAEVCGCDLVFRDVARKAIATATTDARGAFSLRINQRVHDVLLDPLGWRHVEPGPLPTERALAIDLRVHRGRFFCLRGSALDDSGQPANGWRVQANGDRGRIAATTTAADGTFALWSTQAIASVEAHSTMPRMGRLGPWRADAEVALDERRDALVLVSGRFVDKHGAPRVGAMLFSCMAEAAPRKGTPAIGGTDSQGRFFVRRIPKTPFLFAVSGDENSSALAAIPYDGKPLELRAK